MSFFQRQTSGSVVCSNCGRLVGVNDERCYQCGKWNPGLWGYAPILGKVARHMSFADVVLFGCVTLYILTLVYDPTQVYMKGFLGLLSPGGEALYRFGMSGAVPIFRDGRWWTVLSAAWLHGGLLHIGLNMYWIRQLAPAVAHLYGGSRLVIIYTVSAITGFGVTSAVFLLGLPGPLAGAAYTVGASAPLFGLFGALFHYGERTGNRTIRRQFLYNAVIIIIFGLMVPFVDNWAHLGGFAGGWAVSRFWLDPLKDEKPEHVILALVCILLSVASVIVSFLHLPIA